MDKVWKDRGVEMAIFDLGWRMVFIRYGIVTFIALSFSHIFTSQIPFVGPYQFPSRPFFNILWIGALVCSASWAVTLVYRSRIFTDDRLTLNRVLRFIGINFITVSLLYTLVQLIFFKRITGPNFAIGLFVIGFLAIIENLSFLLVSIKTSTAEEPLFIIVPAVKKKLKVSHDEIAYFKLKDGIIYLFTNEGKKVSTGLNSMDALQENLPSTTFFRANRQFLVNKLVMAELKKIENRKLELTVSAADVQEQITISRYRSKELSDWLSTDAITL